MFFFILLQPQLVEKVVMIDHPPYPDYTDKSFVEDVFPQFASQNRFLDTLETTLSLPAAKRKILNLSKVATTEGVSLINKLQKKYGSQVVFTITNWCRFPFFQQRIFLQKVAYELIKVNNQFRWKTNHKFLIEGYCKNFRPPTRGRSEHQILIIRCKDSSRVT